MSGLDWRDARVVRDAAGRVWLRDPHEQMWTAHADHDTGWQRAELEREHGPLTPVLDADGQPIVRTPMAAADRSLLLHVAEQLDSLSYLVCDLVERHLAGNAPESGPVRPCGAASPGPDPTDTPSPRGPQNAETEQ